MQQGGQGKWCIDSRIFTVARISHLSWYQM